MTVGCACAERRIDRDAAWRCRGLLASTHAVASTTIVLVPVALSRPKRGPDAATRIALMPAACTACLP